MKNRWLALCLRIDINRGQCKLFELLQALYSNRHYHSLDHIADCLERFDEIKHLAKHPNELEVAIWFHDSIYITVPGAIYDNEGESAELASKILSDYNISINFRKMVRRLILTTRHNILPTDEDGKLMVDIDLAGLGYSPELFELNGQKIRKEYSWVKSDDDFWTARADFFRKMMAGRPNIYLTEYFRGKYEKQARLNLQNLLEKYPRPA